jgi:hypothetical protein
MDRTYKPAEFASLVGRTPQTLRLWDKKGLLSAKRTPGNQRYYTDADLRHALNLDIKPTFRTSELTTINRSPKLAKNYIYDIYSIQNYLKISMTIF